MSETMIDRMWSEIKRNWEQSHVELAGNKKAEAWEEYNMWIIKGEKK